MTRALLLGLMLVLALPAAARERTRLDPRLVMGPMPAKKPAQ